MLEFNHEESLANHRITRWTFADAVARVAKAELLSTDVDKVAKQLSDNSYWIVTAVVSGVPTWMQFGATSPDLLIKYPVSFKAYGTIPVLIASISLATGTYIPKASLGASLPSQTATITIKTDVTTIATIGGSPGGLGWQSGTSFTLSAVSTLDFYLSGGSASTLSICKGLEFV